MSTALSRPPRPRTAWPEICVRSGKKERAAAGAVCAEKIKTLGRDAVSLQESARNQRQAANHGVALQGYLDALGMAQEALKLQLVAMALQPDRSEEIRAMLDVPVAAEIKDEVRALLDQFSLTEVSGGNQWISSSEAIEEPLAARLTAGEEKKPVPNLPVSFAFSRGKGRLQGVVNTSEAGTATSILERIEPSGETVCRVVAGLALEILAGDVDISGITTPAVEFILVLRSKANTVFAVYVEEKDLDGTPVLSPLVGDAVKQAMLGEGYKLLEEEKFGGRVAASDLKGDSAEQVVVSAFASVRQRLRRQNFLLAVIGSVQTQLLDSYDTSEGKLHIVRADATLRLVDAAMPAGRRTVFVVKAQGKGAFTDDKEEASRRARLALAPLCATKLLAGLNRQFGGS